MKRLFLIIALAIAAFCAVGQTKETYLYAEKDTSKLYMDVYVPEVQNEQHSCLMFVFGGGFIGGKRDDSQIQQVWRHFTEQGYVVIAIDYRLGMRGQKEFAPLLAVKNFHKAIDMAAEDVISALVKKSYSETYGARSLRRTIQKDIEDAVAEAVVARRAKSAAVTYAVIGGYN